MNERIKALVERAEKYAEETSTWRGDNTEWRNDFEGIFKEQFAELMVAQFDLILVNEYLDCVGENDKKSQFRIDRLRNRVKEYFGVEE